jgi:hypothetical protein
VDWICRKRLDVCLLNDEGEVVGELAVAPDLDGLRGLVGRVGLGMARGCGR